MAYCSANVILPSKSGSNAT